MAPQTNIGSSTPVSVGGEDIQKDLRNKVVINDVLALPAPLHASTDETSSGWMRRYDAARTSAREALQMNVIDVIAPDLPTLLNQVDGMETQPKMLLLETAGAKVDEVEMSFWKRILDTLIDPNLIVILMSIGVPTNTELWSPGLILPGTVERSHGSSACSACRSFPSAGRVLLLLLAAGFFVAEMFVVSHGALALAGAVAFVIGSLMLFDPAGESHQVSLQVALGVAATMASVVGLVVAKLVQAHALEVATGQEELIGQVGIVRQVSRSRRPRLRPR